MKVKGDTRGMLLWCFLCQAPSYLTFNIGSVDSFERNLEQAQKELGIHPSDFIPVTYKPDSDWVKSFFINVFPTALLIGAIYFMSRRASGSKGVRGQRLCGVRGEGRGSVGVRGLCVRCSKG